MLLNILRLVCLTLTIYGCLDCSMPAATNEFIAGREGGRCRYLTNIGLYLCVISMTFGFLKRLLDTPILRKTHTFLASVSLPVNLTVFIIYWPILLHDVNHFRRMEVYLKGGIVSTFTDLCQHLIPEIGAILDIYGIDVQPDIYQRYFLMLYGLFYYIYCIKVSKVKGLWPYPFLERISCIGRFGFYLSVIVISLVVYEIMMQFIGRRPSQRPARKVKMN